jgi:hypothetical protein
VVPGVGIMVPPLAAGRRGIMKPHAFLSSRAILLRPSQSLPGRSNACHPRRNEVGVVMIQRPTTIGSSRFVILFALRTKQLVRGCTPRVVADRRPSITAQMEVADGRITASAQAPPPGNHPVSET